MHQISTTFKKTKTFRLFFTFEHEHFIEGFTQCCFCCYLQVKVILGEDREATGELISIDDKDGIVRMDLDNQLKIHQLRFLGRVATKQDDGAGDDQSDDDADD